MNSIQIPLPSGEVISCQSPENWNELTIKQIIAFIKLVYLRFDQLFEKTDEGYKIKDIRAYRLARITLLYSCLNIKGRKFLNLPEGFVHRLIEDCKLIDFLFTKQDLTKNPLPVINTGKRDLYGPGDNFKGFTPGEFNFADLAYTFYERNKAEEHLNKLIAILYRPAKPDYNPASPDTDGDIREKFNRHTIELRIEEVSKIPLEHKIAILLYYRGCRSFLPATFPHIFSGTNTEKSKNVGWLPIILEMAGDKFGEFEKTERADFMLFLSVVDKQIEKAKKLEEEMRKNQ